MVGMDHHPDLHDETFCLHDYVPAFAFSFQKDNIPNMPLTWFMKMNIPLIFLFTFIPCMSFITSKYGKVQKQEPPVPFGFLASKYV